eukprot:436572-Karenia_brevis.AAC.1
MDIDADVDNDEILRERARKIDEAANKYKDVDAKTRQPRRVVRARKEDEENGFDTQRRMQEREDNSAESLKEERRKHVPNSHRGVGAVAARAASQKTPTRGSADRRQRSMPAHALVDESLLDDSPD